MKKHLIMYTLVTALIVIQMLLILPENKAFACSCAGGSVAERLSGSNAVFSGKVIDVGKSVKGDIGRLREYTFQVHKSWKGATVDTITIYSYDGSEASCGFAFDMNGTYLVYAYMGQNGWLQTNFCNGNLKDAEAQADYASLGTPPHVIDEAVNIRHAEMAKSEWLPSAVWYIMGGIVLLGAVLLLIAVKRKRV
ncbi:hypothetical protein [Paenibacillus sedimenti]|uniref:Tissue inhibitor of metalloproteinase n=1 Tax=Paenibacillus sedimenti TaxID=2770274 RepID=A0A926KUT0_9BACL|nr:hypothetical protein [Paenibacillus sedimenti]MBD0382529.1 hypothetical protein [Paenibacillus sedimenti]